MRIVAVALLMVRSALFEIDQGVTSGGWFVPLCTCSIDACSFGLCSGFSAARSEPCLF